MGSYAAGGVLHGFLYSGGSYNTLDPPGSSRTNSRAINNDGQIVGFLTVGGNSHGFL